jgi:hypothetical protein
MTLLEEIKYIESVCLKHKMVKTFMYCEAWEVLGKVKPWIKYPLALMVPTTTVYGEKVILRSYNFSIMDIPSKSVGADDTLRIQSDSEQTLIDIVNKIVFDDEEAVFVNQPTGSVFKENFGDWVAGAGVDVTIESDNSGSCLMPFNE